MKKLGAIFVVLIICSAMPVFSQMRMNGWGRVVWVPLFTAQDGDAKSTMQSPWGDRPDLEFMFSASSTNIGVDLGVMVAPNEFYQIGNAKVWWRPNEHFKLHLGSGRVPTLRGKVAASTGAYVYAWGRLSGFFPNGGKNAPVLMIGDGDGIFSRFNLTDQGAILEFTPKFIPALEGLYVGAAVAPQWTKDGGILAETVYQGIHAVIGYEVKDIGHFRFGFIGGNEINGETANASKNWDFSYDRRIEAAFALSLVPNFLVDLGFKYSLHEHPGILAQPGFSLENPLYLALGLMYTGVDRLSVGFAIDGHFAGDKTLKTSYESNPVVSAPQIAFNIYPTYDLGFCDVGMDLSFGMQFGDEKGINDKKSLGFGAHIQKRYGHGNIRLGIYGTAPLDEDQKWGMSIPVWITYSF
jgi:hypothetical protein